MIPKAIHSSVCKPLKKRQLRGDYGLQSRITKLEEEGYFPLRSLPTVWNLCLQIHPGAPKPHPTATNLTEQPLSLRGTHEPLNLSLTLKNLRRTHGCMNLPLATALSHKSHSHVTFVGRSLFPDDSSVINRSYYVFDENRRETTKSYHSVEKSGSRLFKCRICQKDYRAMCSLKIHIQTHTLPFKCNLCEKAFSRPWLLQGHIRTHTGEKPFSCHLCQRSFADRSNLRAHLQIHAKVKKYLCSLCSKSFSRISLLRKHTSNCDNLQKSFNM